MALEILEAAMKETKDMLVDEMTPANYEESLFIATRSPIQEHLKNEVSRFTNGLMIALDGGQPNTIDNRVNTHLRKIKKDMRQELIDKVHEFFPNKDAIRVNVFFGELHTQLYEKYKEKIAEYTTPEMEHDVPDSVIEERLSGSKDTLCYISGWLLTAILNLVMANVDKGTLQKFVVENSVKKNETNDSMHTAVIDQREKQEDALRRPGEAWYAFSCLFEALFLVNINALQVLHHRGRVLQKITITAGKSDALRQKFMECIPDSFNLNERKQIWRVYYLFIIPTFSALKSGDVMKRIREARPANSMDKLATRTYALVAKERAKTNSSV